MQGKIETIKNISRLGIDTILLNGNINNRLYDTLVGRKTKNTLVHGEKR
jgi:isopentenyl phosphate kinase